MRIWSIHPRYLDTKGLLAVWREGLLALHVLTGRTKGYTKHPQLIRFREHATPLAAITDYLHSIVDEADARGYRFKRQKLQPFQGVSKIPVYRGQIEYESEHLKKKLLIRDEKKFAYLEQEVVFSIHPLFELIEGPVALWEREKEK